MRRDDSMSEIKKINVNRVHTMERMTCWRDTGVFCAQYNTSFSGLDSRMQ